MKQIESMEQREKALEWMVQTAQELEHPLLSEEDKAKKLKVYDYVSNQVQEYNQIVYSGIEYPSLEEQKPQQPPKQVASDWLDD